MIKERRFKVVVQKPRAGMAFADGGRGENGYHIDLPSIGHGVRKVESNINQDPDYITLINQLK